MLLQSILKKLHLQYFPLCPCIWMGASLILTQFSSNHSLGFFLVAPPPFRKRLPVGSSPCWLSRSGRLKYPLERKPPLGRSTWQLFTPLELATLQGSVSGVCVCSCVDACACACHPAEWCVNSSVSSPSHNCNKTLADRTCRSCCSCTSSQACVFVCVVFSAKLQKMQFHKKKQNVVTQRAVSGMHRCSFMFYSAP